MYKAVRELEAHHLAEEIEDGVQLTLLGRLLYERYQSFASVADEVRRHAHLLSELPADAPITPDLLNKSDIVLPERHAPNRPVQRVTELVEGAEQVVALAPVALPAYVELFYEQIVDENLTAEFVFEPPVIEYLGTDYGEMLEEAAATGRFTATITDAELPFGLVVSEGERTGVAVIVYAEGGELRGIISNETPEALDWGREVYGYYRSDATRPDESN